MRSTAARSSSSVIRLNSPSTTTSLTVSSAAGVDAAQRAEREEHGGLHLDGEHAAPRPALVLPAVRVVEDVARHDRADAHRLADLLRRVDGAVHDLPARGRAVRLVVDVRVDGAVGRDCGQRDDQVAELHVGLEAAARADADEALDAELHELLDDDRGRGTAHAGRLDGDRLALPRARVAEHPALGVPLHGVVEVRLGDVLRAERVAGEEARLCVLARFGTDVDRHGRDPILCARIDRVPTVPRARRGPRVLRRGSGGARHPRGRRAARARPVRRAARATDG